jgi:hypothetical protein
MLPVVRADIKLRVFQSLCSINLLYFRYFSLRFVWETMLPNKPPYLFIAPPHGLLPKGNLLAVHAMRNLTGFDVSLKPVCLALLHHCGPDGWVYAPSRSSLG